MSRAITHSTIMELNEFLKENEAKVNIQLTDAYNEIIGNYLKDNKL